MDPFAEKIITPPSLKWYQRWWVIMLIIFGAIMVTLAIGFTMTVFYYKKNIESGKYFNPQTGRFSSEFPIAPSALPGKKQNVSVDNDPSRGSVYAPVTIIAFEDFQCPFCGQAYPIVKELLAKHPDDVLFVYRDFPLIGIHEDAVNASEAAECAHEQGKFWEYHDALYENQSNLTLGALQQYAISVGLEKKSFEECLSTGKYKDEVTADIRDGLAAGVDATPTWFINGVRYRGVLDLAEFEAIIKAEKTSK